MMPKLKTHKGVSRRVKITGRGKLVHFKAGRRHLLTGKPSRSMRRLRGSTAVSPEQVEKLRRLLPYSA